VKQLKIYFIWAAWERLIHLHYNIPPMGILRIAGDTPQHHSIFFTDEMVSPVDMNSDAQIVAISFLTPASHRAYQLSAIFREQGKYVVFGGAHTTIIPDEARSHADTIFIGEGEGIWQQFLQDFQEGVPQPVYRHKTFPGLSDLPEIRRDLLAPHQYPYENPIATGVESMELSRGCKSRCVFCSVPKTQGSWFRNIPLNDIVKGYQDVALSAGFLFFTDNNLLGNWEHTERALQALIPYEKDWFGLMAPEDAAKDQSKLDLMIKSGLCGVYGTVKAVNGRESEKDLQNRTHRLKRLGDLGVTIIATFTLGLDDQGPDVFDRTLNLCIDAGLQVPEFIINTPFPGSKLFDMYDNDNRILSRNWSEYNGNHVVYRPLLMSEEQLKTGYNRCYETFYAGVNRDQILFESLQDRFFEAMIRARKKQIEKSKP